MNLNFMDFEIPLLKALISLGGSAKPSDIYPEVEKMMGLNPTEFPEEYEKYKSNMINRMRILPPKKVSTKSRTCKYMKPVVYLVYGVSFTNRSTNKV